MTDTIVFLGPTLNFSEARNILNAEYLPPVSQGDVFSVSRDYRPKAIIIIDGTFDSAPSVRHKEILWALMHGIKVYGCSSMGALRAAELSSYGMIGYGLVYRWYRTTPLADDDEVTVGMGPRELGSPPLSEALIDIRATLKRARNTGVISSNRARSLLEIARGVFFLDRTYEKLLTYSPHTSNVRLSSWLNNGGRVSLKETDARNLLHNFASGQLPCTRATAKIDENLTLAWRRDLEASNLSPPK